MNNVITDIFIAKSYSYQLIILSIMIAMFSSYVAFGLAERSAYSTDKTYKITWNIFGASAMGLGIWTMHFIGMLALKLPVIVRYDELLTVISVIPAICSCSVVLWIMIQQTLSRNQILIGGALLGSGIGIMHYLGVAAMHLDAEMVHHMGLVFFSIVAAVILAIVALSIQAGRLKQVTAASINKKQIINAVVMGAAISSMHYIAMMAVNFVPLNTNQITVGISGETLSIFVSIITFMLLMLALFIPKLQGYKETTIKSAKLLENAMEYALIGVWELSLDGKITQWSEQMYRLFGLPLNTSPGSEALCAITNESNYSIFIKSIENIVATGNEHCVEYMITRRNDGEKRWIECRGKVVNDKAGKPAKISGFAQDITERKYNAQILLQSESRFRSIFEQIDEAWLLIDPKLEGTFIAGNKAATVMLGFQGHAQIFPIHPAELSPEYQPDGRLSKEKAEEMINISLKNKYHRFEWTHCSKYRDNFPVEVSLTPMLVGGEQVIMTAWQDITKQKQAEKGSLLSTRVFNDIHEGITITDANKIIIDVNPAFCSITGYNREDVIGQNTNILSSGKQSPEFYQHMWQQINQNGHWQGEVWNRKKNGELYAERLTISTLLNDDNHNVVNYIGVFSDITNHKKQQEQLSFMAHYDVLTGLPNRALFADRFTQAIAHSKRTERQLAICFLDLDDFKPVNDNYGHDVGDKLLIEVAQRITANVRDEDTVSRQGGDEFAILLNDIESSAQCEQALHRIHYALAQPFFIDNYSHEITASIGVTLYPNDNGDIDTLMRHADQAMYQAKVEGKHRYHLFNAEHDQRTIQKHHQLGVIEEALVNNEFQLYYQPKVNMVTGEVFGAEALIRWIHPEKGLIPPLDFLPAIEGSKLEIKVGNWVINAAITQLETWLKQGVKTEVSINISSNHLLSEAFFAKLDSALAQHPMVDAQCLQLEILESSALGDLNAISTIIETCQGVLGVNFALDDFGTGYSSLTHLRSLPANTIKIDQSFVRDMLDDPSDYAIIDGIIGLADSFNKVVIAEGVETTNHGLMLVLMGCQEAQGYGIAKPMPANDFPQWLKNYRPNKEWQLAGNKCHTLQENKVELFRLVTQQLKYLFINNIKSSPENVAHWPIMNSKLCPCGIWIKRVRQEKLFEEASLKKLNQAHEALHLIAQALYLQYQEGDVDAAREGLPEFQIAFDDMSRAL